MMCNALLLNLYHPSIPPEYFVRFQIPSTKKHDCTELDLSIKPNFENCLALSLTGHWVGTWDTNVWDLCNVPVPKPGSGLNCKWRHNICSLCRLYISIKSKSKKKLERVNPLLWFGQPYRNHLLHSENMNNHCCVTKRHNLRFSPSSYLQSFTNLASKKFPRILHKIQITLDYTFILFILHLCFHFDIICDKFLVCLVDDVNLGTQHQSVCRHP